MKSGKKITKEYVRSLIKTYLLEAEKEEKPADDAGEENPFAAAGEEGGEKKDEEEGNEKEEKPKKPAEEPAGIPVSFNISKVKQYNKANFLSNSGIVKSIDKRGIVVTTQPDGVDVLVNFSDISESVKAFFKNKK